MLNEGSKNRAERSWQSRRIVDVRLEALLHRVGMRVVSGAGVRSEKVACPVSWSRARMMTVLIHLKGRARI